MASIKLQLQSKSETAPIYLRLSIKRGFYLKRKTGLFIDYKNWSTSTGLPKQNNPTNKNLTTRLRNLTTEIIKDLNNANSNGTELNGNWLEYRINLHFGRIQEKGTQSNLLTDTIQRYIKLAPTRKNGKGGIGLSKSRINAYKGLKNVIYRYEKENDCILKIKDVNLEFVSLFTEFMQQQKYNNSNTQKKISDIKTICLFAQVNGIETHHQLKNVTGIKTQNEYIIYLNKDELLKIEKKEFKRSALINAKFWLLLGAEIGQRGNDLMSLNDSNIILKNGIKRIELKQQKTSKKVIIPFSPKMGTLLKNGFPYKISLQKLNKHLKEVCKLAEINTITEGYKYNKKIKRRVLGKYPKHELITSHDLRRSFASNYYGEMPTPLIMSITGHSTEKTFLNYIGKTADDYAQQIADFHLLQIEKAKKQSNLTVVKNTAV